MGIVAIIIIPCSFHSCTTILSLSWNSKVKEDFNHPRYGRVYNCKYSQIIGCHNNFIIMNSSMMEYTKNSTNTSIEIYFMSIWWTCILSLRKVIMVLLILIILHVMVKILSNFLLLHTPFNQTWVCMVKLFPPVKSDVKEPFLK